MRPSNVLYVVVVLGVVVGLIGADECEGERGLHGFSA